MEMYWILIGGVVLLIVAYICIKAFYITHVSEKYGYDIQREWTRYIPAVASFIVIGKEILAEIQGNPYNIPLDIIILLIGMGVYAIILYVKTKSILHSILVALFQTIVGIVTVISIFIAIFLGNGKGNNENRGVSMQRKSLDENMYQNENTNSQSEEENYSVYGEEVDECLDKRNMYL